jgi:hypothetical protein
MVQDFAAPAGAVAVARSAAQVRERLGTQATSGLKRSLDDASAALEI